MQGTPATAPQGAPTVAPPAPGAPVTFTPQTPAGLQQTGASPQEAYQALVNQRRELRNQLSSLEERRTSIATRLRQGNAADGADHAGLEARLADLDRQIVEQYRAVAAAEAAVAQQAAVPGSVVPPPPPFPRQGPPEEAYALGMLLVLVIGLPITIAYARRIWRRSGAAVAAIPKDFAERMSRLEESVESVAIEVERIGEGQRFVTNLFIEHGGPNMLGAGAMEPVSMPERERERVRDSRSEAR